MKFRYVLLCSATLIAQAAFCDPSVNVILPQSSLQLESRDAIETSNFDSRLEVLTSSWSPDQYRLESQVPGATLLKSTGIPHFQVAVLFSPWSQPQWAKVALKLGASISHLSRSGFLPGTLSSVPSEQQVYLVSGILGVEIAPSFLRVGRVSTHIGTALLPTEAMTERSIFDRGVNSFGVIGQSYLGGETDLQWLVKTADLHLNLDVLMTYGSLMNGNLLGWGIGGGVRVPL